MNHVEILLKRLVDFSEPGHPTYNKAFATWWDRVMELDNEEMNELLGYIADMRRIRQWMDTHNGAEPTMNDIYPPQRIND